MTPYILGYHGTPCGTRYFVRDAQTREIIGEKFMSKLDGRRAVDIANLVAARGAR